jgi:hypothetical protein
MKNGKPSRRAVLREVGQLMTQDVRRRRLNRRPQFASATEITHNYLESDLATIA